MFSSAVYYKGSFWLDVMKKHGPSSHNISYPLNFSVFFFLWICPNLIEFSTHSLMTSIQHGFQAYDKFSCWIFLWFVFLISFHYPLFFFRYVKALNWFCHAWSKIYLKNNKLKGWFWKYAEYLRIEIPI